MTRCDCCGSALPASFDAVQAKLDDLVVACEAAGVAVSFDGFVCEQAAAALLGWSKLTLRNRRLTDEPIPYRRIGRTPEYALRDLARFVLNRTYPR